MRLKGFIYAREEIKTILEAIRNQAAGSWKSPVGEQRMYNLRYAKANMEIPAKLRIEKVARRISDIRASEAMRRNLGCRGLLVARLLLKQLALCASAFVVLTPSIWAQQGGSGSSSTPGWPLHNSAPDHALPDAIGTQVPNIDKKDQSCLMWTVAEAKGTTISARTLQVPEKVRDEYRKACSDLKGKKLLNAEDRLRKAVQGYPQYAAAWALLGQVLEAEKRLEEARGACSESTSVDSAYVPGYLCLADVAAQKEEWNQTLDLADRALTLEQDVYGYFYCAMAQFHLSHLPAAEKNAIQAIDADHFQRVPQVHLLLAQIYGAKHDFYGAATQLRAYLRVAPTAPDSAGVRKSLAELEGQIPK
jgi:TolA-binding protein